MYTHTHTYIRRNLVSNWYNIFQSTRNCIYFSFFVSFSSIGMIIYDRSDDMSNIHIVHMYRCFFVLPRIQINSQILYNAHTSRRPLSYSRHTQIFKINLNNTYDMSARYNNMLHYRLNVFMCLYWYFDSNKYYWWTMRFTKERTHIIYIYTTHHS